jgi:replicative superfamily II helicase
VDDDVDVELDELEVELRAAASEGDVLLSSEQLANTSVVVATKASTR